MKCAYIDARYLWIKKEIQNKKEVGRMTKVKVCHSKGNQEAHTILIACPGLNGHKHHDDDYIGVCRQ